jgi:6-phospho-beta-glucosidase
MELIKQYPVDFLSFTYYRSRIASKDYLESVQKETNTSDKEVSGDTSYRGDTNIVNTGKTNPYLKMTPSGWSIDPDGLYLALVDLYGRYNLPLFVAENGLGVKEELVDGKVHDRYRMEYLKDHAEAMLRAIRNGVDLFGYAWWGPIDLVSNGSGQMSKRYGFIYVDRNDAGEGTMKRYRKDSFYYYKKLIASNGRDLDLPK